MNYSREHHEATRSTLHTRDAESIWRGYGRRMGWSMDECQFLVDEYRDEREEEVEND